MKNKKQTNLKKEISIPLFIPLLIIIFSIIIFIKASEYNSTVITSANEGTLKTNFQNESENKEVDNLEETLPENKNTVVEEIEETEEVIEIQKVEEKAEPQKNKHTQNTSPKTATYTVDGEPYTVIGILNIPTLNIEYAILSETSTKLLKVSLNKYWGANPNEVGNMVVVGHNYKDNKFFSNLSKIKHGEIVKITDLTGKTLDYKVYDTYVIDPYDNSCTSQLTDGKTEITLITCHYENGSNHATKRFVVKARVE